MSTTPVRFREVLPSPALRPFVQLIWWLEADAGVPMPTERVVPDGLMELVLHYRDPLEVRHAGEPFVVQERSSLVSQTRRFVEFRPCGTVGMVSVRFRPWGGHHFVGCPVSAFADRIVAADELWDTAEIAEVEAALAAARTVSDRIRHVESFLVQQLRRHRKDDVEVPIRAVWRRRGSRRVSALCDDLGIGERSLERIFAAAVGTTPKTYSRIVRFLAACKLMRRGEGPSLTDVGLACGYYDQAHFIGECRELAGMTPTEVVAASQLSFLELD